MARILSILNLQHGGGKTTTVLNLASALARRGANVLAVDLDTGETLARRVQLLPGSPAASFPDTRTVHVLATAEGWHLLTSPVSLALLQTRVLYRVVRKTTYFDELAAMFDAYDYVLVDGSTAETTLLMEVLALSNEVIVPLDSGSLQFDDGVVRLRELLATGRLINPGLQFGGVFLARYLPCLRRAREMLTALSDALGPVNCFAHYLGESEAVRQAERRRESVLATAPTSRAARVFTLMARDIAGERVPRLIGAPADPTRASAVDVRVAHAQPHTSPRALPLELPGAPGIAPPVWTASPDHAEVGHERWRQPILSNDWLQLARRAEDHDQAMRYAVLALSQTPSDRAVIALFETRLEERILNARVADTGALVTLARFLGDHGFAEYAARLYRCATDLNPNEVAAWAGIFRSSPSDVEREHALQMCLHLDATLAATPSLPPHRAADATARRSRTLLAAFAGRARGG